MVCNVKLYSLHLHLHGHIISEITGICQQHFPFVCYDIIR